MPTKPGLKIGARVSSGAQYNGGIPYRLALGGIIDTFEPACAAIEAVGINWLQNCRAYIIPGRLQSSDRNSLDTL